MTIPARSPRQLSAGATRQSSALTPPSATSTTGQADQLPRRCPAPPHSRQWLYTQPELRVEIERLRDRPPPVARRVPDAERAREDSLRQRNTMLLTENQRLREENAALRSELAILYGERRQAPAG